jgi:transmembrane sensor
MTQRTQQRMRQEAIGWHLRLREGEPSDWDQFVQWLERDPAHSDAFDEVKRADASIEPDAVPAHGAPADSHAAPESLPVQARRGFGRFWATGLAAVAALVLFGFIALPWSHGPSAHYEIATAAGERRSVDIGGGSSVTLNGGTRLILDRNDPRHAELVVGEATFTVQHEDGRPFTVVAGAHRVRNVGTRFNVISDSGRFSVAVIEGAVSYDSGGARVSLTAGQALTAREGSRPLLARGDPAQFAGWQEGRLSYTSAPINEVARDLSRTTGADIRVAPSVRAMPFTGSILVERDHAATTANFAATLGLRARRTSEGWLIEPQVRAPR